MEKEVVGNVTLPSCEDDEEDDNSISDTPYIPSHSEAFNALSTRLCWLVASYPGLFICVGVKKRPCKDCNAQAHNLHINCYSLMCKFQYVDVLTV